MGYCRRCATDRSREWREAHRAEFRLRTNAFYRKRREEIIAAYGGKCACCNESRFKFLAIDHVHGNGTAHRRSVTGPNGNIRDFYRWIRKHNFPPGFRILCHNCNMAIGLYGTCAHVEE